MASELEDVLANRRAWWVEQGECLEVLKTLPDECVHLCVTSPPYYGLRDYKTGQWQGGDPNCDHGVDAQNKRRLQHNASSQRQGRTADESKLRDGVKSIQTRCKKCGAVRQDRQLGMEPTPEEYIARLVDICREVRRVLRPEATFWLNVGDSYTSQGGTGQLRHWDGREKNLETQSHRVRPSERLKSGDMCGIPWRLAMALQADGWWLRSDNLWIKKSAMPISVKGWRWERCRIRDPHFRDKKYGGKGQDQDPQSSTERLKRNCATARSYGVDHEQGAVGVGWTDCPGCKKCQDTGGYILRKGSWRTTAAHEYIFMLAKSEEYFADGFAVRQQLAQATLMRDRYTRVLDDPEEQYACRHDHETVSDPEAGANLRSFFVFRNEPGMFRLRSDLTPEQRAYVVRRMLGEDSH